MTPYYNQGGNSKKKKLAPVHFSKVEQKKRHMKKEWMGF
jgi:hypothetical protein